MLCIVADGQMVELRASNETTAASWYGYLEECLAASKVATAEVVAQVGGTEGEGMTVEDASDADATLENEKMDAALSATAVPADAKDATAAADAAAEAAEAAEAYYNFDGPVDWSVEVRDDAPTVDGIDQWFSGHATHFCAATHTIFITGFENGLEGEVCRCTALILYASFVLFFSPSPLTSRRALSGSGGAAPRLLQTHGGWSKGRGGERRVLQGDGAPLGTRATACRKLTRL